MRSRVWRMIGAFGVFAIVGVMAAVPAGAVVFTINGGVVETGGITTPCGPPCVQPPGQPGIPVGTQGYVAQNNVGGVPNPVPPASMSLLATPGTIVFHYLGSDAQFHNQFRLDTDRNGSFETLVFDNQSPNNPDFNFSNTVNGALPFEYISDIGGNNDPLPGNPSNSFNIFLACVPNAGNPRTCSQGFIGLADGRVFNANDDHQDLGVSFRTPEPGSLILLGAGLFGLGLGSLRRRKA